MKEFLVFIQDLHHSLKFTIYSMCAIMPFWYVALYMFCTKLFYGFFYVPIAFSFCLTLVLYGMCKFINSMIANFPTRQPFLRNPDNIKIMTESSAIYSTILSIIILGTSIFLTQLKQKDILFLIRTVFETALGLNIFLFVVSSFVKFRTLYRERNNKQPQ